VSRYSVTLEMLILCDGPDELDTFTDALYEHLLTLNDAADMGGSLTSGLFEFTLEVDADDAVAAVDDAAVTLRTAAHAVNANTARWPTADAWPEWIRSQAVGAREITPDDDLVVAG
jgi:hypothetical protein